MSTSVDDRIAAGVAWLDAVAPGWWDVVDLDRLDIKDCEDCIIGQLFGRGDRDYDPAFGFDADEDAGPYSDQWPELTEKWHRVISERRSAP